MAVTFSREKESGDKNSVTYPYLVVETDDVWLGREAAIEAARDDASALEGNVDPTDYRFRRVSKRAMRVDITFSRIAPPVVTSPPVGKVTVDFQFSFQAQGKFLTEAPEWLETYGPDGPTGEEIRAINVERTSEGGERVVGREYLPLPEVFALEVVLPNARISPTYKQLVRSLCGRFNSAPLVIDGLSYAPGQIQLVRAAMHKRTDEDYRLSFGFGYVENRTNVDAGGGITIPEVRGHWDYWVMQKFLVVNIAGRQLVKTLPDLAVLQRVWDEADLNDLVPTAD